MDIFGVRLVGINSENGQKLLYTLGLILVIWLFSRIATRVISFTFQKTEEERVRFWTRQVVSVALTVITILGLLSIWFDDPTRLATGIGIVTAGLAFALQRVVTAVAGYFIILRGETFNIGDRIAIGPVRGDVVQLSFTQTTIMEMGQPASMSDVPPPAWIQSRQYTGRVVTVSNAMIFDEPVYNYSRDFPYLWDEISLALPLDADWQQAEEILLDIAHKHTIAISQMSREALTLMQQRYHVHAATLEPQVYVRIVENGIELTVRFVVTERGVRDIKNAAYRDILARFKEADIPFTAPTLAITDIPPVPITGAGPAS